MKRVVVLFFLFLPGCLSPTPDVGGGEERSAELFTVKDVVLKDNSYRSKAEKSLERAREVLARVSGLSDRAFRQQGGSFSQDRFISAINGCVHSLQSAASGDEVTTRLEGELNGIVANLQAKDPEDNLHTIYMDLYEREYDFFMAQFDALKRRYPDQAFGRDMDRIRADMERAVEFLMMALLVYDSEDPDEVLQFHLDAQRMFKAECYLRFTEAFRFSVD